MGDLHCAATLVLARHGEAEQVASLARSLRTRRVATVYSGPTAREVASAELAAAILTVAARTADGLQELSPGVEDDRALVARFARALEQIADQHRGETVLVLAHAGVLSRALPRLATDAAADPARVPVRAGAVLAEVEVDEQGIRVVWSPGRARTVGC